MPAYDPRLQQAVRQFGPEFERLLNHLAGSARVHEQQLGAMQQQVADLQDALNATAMRRSGDQHPGVVRIEDIPGRRVPYTLLVDIPIGANTTSQQTSSVTISQEGPFIAVRRMATFQSIYEFVTTDLLGLVLLPAVLPKTPPYVERVVPGSPAEIAGIQPDDLIVTVGSSVVQSRQQLVEELSYIDRLDPVSLTVLRAQELIPFELVIRSQSTER